jgi:hypothetical protein
MRLESQLSRMNSQTFSCEFSSTFGWQRDDADVVGHNQPRREVPSGLIEQQHRMTARRDLGRDGRQVQVHRLGVAPGHDEACRLAFLGTDGSEDVGRGSALVVRSRWSGSSLCPATGDLVLLTDAGFVAEPDLYVGEIEAPFVRNLLRCSNEVFLNASIAPSAWA